MDRFIKLPWYVKMLISPIAILFFFTLIFPVVIILGILYKVLLFLSKGLKEIFRNWKLVRDCVMQYHFIMITCAYLCWNKPEEWEFKPYVWLVLQSPEISVGMYAFKLQIGGPW